MDYSEFVRAIELDRYIQELHRAITKKFPADDQEFDAWYTRREYCLREIAKIGQEIARRLRTEIGVAWTKSIPDSIKHALESRGTAPRAWEDGPDGALAGIAILISGWVANQAAAKTRDNPCDHALKFFDSYIRPLINASMDLGISSATQQL